MNLISNELLNFRCLNMIMKIINEMQHHPFTQFDNTIEELNTLPKEQIKAKSYDLV
ncbi:hypothetical protein NWQ33_00680 [Mycoplasmopsis cynos]|nr:hypothetical protein [Mycoplasmopsis cynos]